MALALAGEPATAVGAGPGGHRATVPSRPMSDPMADAELVPVPERGRRFTVTRRVRWGDSTVDHRLRLDAVARYLQDVANDDTRDAGHDPRAAWVVRRTVIEVESAPTVGESLTVTTFSGGHGSRWAERRTSIVGDGDGRVEAASLWVFVDPRSGRPARLTAQFHATYDEAADGRQVSARLHHPPPPDTADARPWPLRTTDLDGLGHVNNAATWEAVEDELARRGLRPRRAVLEYHAAIGPDDRVVLRSLADSDSVSVWLEVDDQVRASALVVLADG